MRQYKEYQYYTSIKISNKYYNINDTIILRAELFERDIIYNDSDNIQININHFYQYFYHFLQNIHCV